MQTVSAYALSPALVGERVEVFSELEDACAEIVRRAAAQQPTVLEVEVSDVADGSAVVSAVQGPADENDVHGTLAMLY